MLVVPRPSWRWMMLSGTPSWASSRRVRVAQLVRREPPPDTGAGGNAGFRATAGTAGRLSEQAKGHPDGASFGGRGPAFEMLSTIRGRPSASGSTSRPLWSTVIGCDRMGASSLPYWAAIVGVALSSLGSLSFRAIHDQGSGGKREVRMRRKDQLRATKLKQVARRIKHGSSKARSLTPVKRAAEAERDYRRRRR
jgi:hypothetical protein